MGFPSLNSIVTKEAVPRNAVPPNVLIHPQWKSYTQYERYFDADFVGAQYNPMVVSDPSKDDFTVADLTLPKSVSVERIEHRLCAVMTNRIRHRIFGVSENVIVAFINCD